MKCPIHASDSLLYLLSGDRVVSCVLSSCDEKSLSVKQIEEEKTQQTTIKVPRCGCLVESIDNI